MANRNLCECQNLVEKYGIEKVYDEIDDVFTDPKVDIIYISIFAYAYSLILEKP